MGTVLSTFSNEDSSQYPVHTPRRPLSDAHKTKEFRCYIPSTPHNRPYDEYIDQHQSINKNLNFDQNGEALTIQREYEYITGNRCTESDKTLNPANMFSLKRFLFFGLSRKTKMSVSNGIIPSLRTPDDRIHRLSVKSDGKNAVYGRGDQRKVLVNSTIETPVFYCHQQQEHLEEDSTKLVNNIRNIQLDNLQFNPISSSSYCDTSIPKEVSQFETLGITRNSYHFESRDIMNDTVSQEYRSSGQNSLTDFKSVYRKDFIIHHDTTTNNEQNKQLSEPNSRLRHRYSHCLSTEFSRKCCVTHHHNNGNIGNTMPYTPSLVDLRWVARSKGSNIKHSNEQLYVSNSPYSPIENNSTVQSCQNNSDYFHIPTSTISENLSKQFSTFNDNASPVDTYPREYHHPHPTHHNYQQYPNNQLIVEQISRNVTDTSPSTRSCSFDMHFPLYNHHNNQSNKRNSSLCTVKDNCASIHMPLATSTLSENSSNLSCVHNCLSAQTFGILDNNTQHNYQKETKKTEEQLSSKLDRRLTEFDIGLTNPSSPIHVQRKVSVMGFDKYRKITKSISCYALKLFTHHNNNNLCQQKYQKGSGESTIMTKSFFRTSNINYDRKMSKLRSDRKMSDRMKKNSSTRDTGELKRYNQQFEQCNTVTMTTTVMTTTTTTKPTNMMNNNQKNTIIPQYYRTDAQSTDCIKCFNDRKSTGKVDGIYGMFENHKFDKYYNMKHLNHDNRSYYETSMFQTSWRRGEMKKDQHQSGSGKSMNNISNTNTTSHVYNLFRQPIFKASTSELLKCLSIFIVARIQMNLLENSNRLRNSDLHGIQPAIIVTWIRAIDRALLLQGWSEVAFINPTHVVFLYMMLRNFIQNGDIHTERELHTIIMACLYLAYSYAGNEISYPLRPFLIAEANQFVAHSEGGNKKLLSSTMHMFTSSSSSSATSSTIITTTTGIESCLKSKVIDEVRNRFWQYVIRIVNEKSSEMLRINAEPVLFTQMFKELTLYDNIVIAMKLFSNRNYNINDNNNN
uniref:Putative cyclin-dependent kinase 5 activator n=1 Tax=Schistosoma mansoni TaxID=6183 RepID=A0A3Q0KQ28_SCHMA